MKDSQPRQPQPAAYDAEGRPLYHHSPSDPSPPTRDSLVRSRPKAYEGHNFDPRLRAQYANEPDIVHATRDFEPKVPAISEEMRRRHEESVKQFPYLNLTEGEFVILRIK